MLATAGGVPAEAWAFAFELRWVGQRGLLRWDGRRLRLRSQADRDLLAQFPEIAALAEALHHPVLLDGMVVAIDETGVARPGALRARGAQRQTSGVRSATPAPSDEADWSVVYIAFDLLHHAGLGLLECPWQERRELLESLKLHGPHWATPPVHADHLSLLASARVRGGEGIVAKRRTSAYLPGETSSEWIDIVADSCECLVVGGYQQTPAGGGTLLVGYFTTADDAARGRLCFAGYAMFDPAEAAAAELPELLTASEALRSPFVQGAHGIDPRGVVWCRPHAVVEVGQISWALGRTFGQARFLRLRLDLAAMNIVHPDGLLP